MAALSMPDPAGVYERHYDAALERCVGQLTVFCQVVAGMIALFEQRVCLAVVTPQVRRRLPLLLPEVLDDVTEEVIAFEDAAARPAPDGILTALACIGVHLANLITGRLRGHRGYIAIQVIPGVGAILGAVFVAEIGDVHRFPGPSQLSSWAGLTPKHHESDTKIHRGRITKQGSTLVRWAAVEAVQRISTHHRLGQIRDQIGCRRGRNIGSSRRSPRAAHPGLLRTTRRAYPLPAPNQRMTSPLPRSDAGRAGHDPQPWRGRPL